MIFDFEKKFSEHLTAFKKGKEPDEEELEKLIPDVYEKWLETPADWLDGKAPGNYFGTVCASELAEELGKYVFAGITVPEILINCISDKREAVYPYLLSILYNYEGEKSEELKEAVLELIDETGLEHPYEFYIEVISSSEKAGGFSEACAGELRETGDRYKERLIYAYETAKNDYASDCFLDILTDLPYDEKTYGYALEKFLFSETKKAFYASCLGKLGNENALPYLEEEISKSDLTYYEYEALRNAIDELGGDVPEDMDFEGDKDYELLMRESERIDKS